MHSKVRRLRNIPFFRIFYSTTFTVLILILASLILITPGDHIYQSFRSRQIYHIFIIAGTNLIVFLVCIFIWAGRLYATRTALAAIPKEWSPLDRNDVAQEKVRRDVRKGLERSALIAHEAHPRDLRDEKVRRDMPRRSKTRLGRKSEDTIRSMGPVWGTISHPGWSSPSSADLPNLHYEPVILELSHLIEAKAVSLAPQDPLDHPDNNSSDPADVLEPPAPDLIAVSVLQRPATMGLRDYISHLSTLGMINPTSLGAEFLTLYEQARFSRTPLTEVEFRALMGIFAEILRNMRPLDATLVERLRAEAIADSESSSINSSNVDAESIATDGTVQRTPMPEAYTSPSSSSSSSTTTASREGTLYKELLSPWKSSSPRASVRQASLASMRRVRSRAKSLGGASARSGAGSVIRLAEEAGVPLDLPYTIVLSDGESIH